MPTIKGPIKFKKGTMDPKMKKWIKDNGINLPFNKRDFKYSESKLDSWLTFRNKGDDKKRWKYDRVKDKDEEVTN